MRVGKAYPSDTDDVIAHRKSCQTNRISWSMGVLFLCFLWQSVAPLDLFKECTHPKWQKHIWNEALKKEISNVGNHHLELFFWTQEALKYIYIYIYLFIYMNIYTPLKTNMDNQNYGLGKDDSFWIWLLLLSTLEFRPWVYLDFLDWFEKTVWMGKGEDLLQKIESHSSHGSCLSTWLGIVRNLYLKVKIDGTDTKR